MFTSEPDTDDEEDGDDEDGVSESGGEGQGPAPEAELPAAACAPAGGGGGAQGGVAARTRAHVSLAHYELDQLEQFLQVRALLVGLVLSSSGSISRQLGCVPI